MPFKTEVKKETLLATLKANRDKHREVYEHAMEGWAKLVTDVLEANLRRVKAGDKWRIYIHEEMPVDHTRQYDQVIKMLEIHVGDTMILDQQDVAHYVMDQWDWKRAFISTSNKFSGAAYTKSKYAEADDDGDDNF